MFYLGQQFRHAHLNLVVCKVTQRPNSQHRNQSHHRGSVVSCLFIDKTENCNGSVRVILITLQYQLATLFIITTVAMQHSMPYYATVLCFRARTTSFPLWRDFYLRCSVVVVWMWCRCGVGVVWMWCGCGVVVVWLWCRCGCGVVVVWVSCGCGVDVVSVWCGCGVGVVWVWCEVSG